MVVIPAIDIRNGKCVRLVQGNFNQETIYSNDPVMIAKRWKQEGADLLHIVDLDGAKNGTTENFEVIKKIAQEVNIPLQVGGGIRTGETIKQLVSLGNIKVILGTIAFENRSLLKQLLNDFAPLLIVALDTKNGKVVSRGWEKNTGRDCLTTVKELEKIGVRKFIYTDVVKDGTMTQPNYKEIENLTKKIKSPFIVSGGVSSIEDIKKLRLLNIEGVIVGKALYEGKIDLKEAMHVS